MYRITPFIKRLRTNGGTIFTFSSAVEDIGLNINERNNVVKISHFALLNIPKIDEPSDSPNFVENRFNINAIPGAWEYAQAGVSIKDGRVLIAESFQNYALNLESNLLNSEDYDATLQRTVSERVFWKWMKESGSIRWDKDSSGNWKEELDADGSLGYNSVVKYIGQVSAGNIRTDNFGTYNETYVLVPTSHGQMSTYFQMVEDANYHHDMEIGGLGENILGREGYTKPHPDGLDFRAYYDFVDTSTAVGTYNTYYYNGGWQPGWWYTAEGKDPLASDNAYLTDSSAYVNTGSKLDLLQYNNGSGSTVTFRRSRVDCMSLVLDLDNLKTIFSDSNLSYDKMAIDYAINDAFNFNAVLIYYSVYNSVQDTVLATNLLGILFLDAPDGNSSNIGFGGILLPSLEKIQSGVGGFGTSYSLRLNIKTDNMVDDTAATIVDAATSDQLYVEDWAEAFYQLDRAVNILTQNNSTINYISNQYTILQENVIQMYNDLKQLEYQVNDIGSDIQGTTGTVALFSDGEDPLIDSSIYMKYGRIGLLMNNPQYPIELGDNIKTKDIFLEKNIRDTSGNILLGYGSPLQIGASTNYRQVDIYTGDLIPVVSMDSSRGIRIIADTSIIGKTVIDGSIILSGTIQLDGDLSSPFFDFNDTYIKDTSNGSTLRWVNGFLEASIGSSVSADGSTGYVQISNNAGLLGSDARFKWDITNRRLLIGKSSGSYTLDVSGIINADVSILERGVYLYGKIKTYTDGSLGSRDTSINWLATNKANTSSLSSYTLKTYVDGSLGARDTSINWIATNKANVSSLNSYTLKTYTDGSLAARDTSINWLRTNSVTFNGSSTDGIVTYGAGQGVVESNLTFDGTRLRVLGSTRGIDSSSLFSTNIAANNIYLKGTSTIEASSGVTAGSNLYINGGPASGPDTVSGGNLYLNGGSAQYAGGNVYIDAGNGGYSDGIVYLNNSYGTLRAANGLQVYGRDLNVSGVDLDLTGKLFVTDSSGISGNVAIIENTYSPADSTHDWNVISLKRTTGYMGYSNFIEFFVDGNGEGVIQVNSGGTLGFVQASDISLKENVSLTETNALNIINKIEIVDFDWKDASKNDNRGRQIGVIAQQVEEILPSMVTKGNSMGIMYETLHPFYIKSIQQLKELIALQEIRIKELESKLN